MKTLSIKVPEGLDQLLARAVRDRGISKSDLVRDALERYFSAGAGGKPGSVLDALEDLCGSVKGPRDLATNPNHMRDFGRDSIGYRRQRPTRRLSRTA